MNDLDDRLREHFASISLDDAALARIHAAERAAGLELVRVRRRPSLARLRGTIGRRLERVRRAARRGGGGFGMAPLRFAALAAVVLAVGVSMRFAGSLDERGERAIREVAMNHVTRLTFEFEDESLAALDRRMHLLPFELAAPSGLPEGVAVLGSRYCSLSGRLAAHVKLRERGTGRPLSLFVTGAAEELERLHGEDGRIDGVRVELFSEGGLFYALARQAG